MPIVTEKEKSKTKRKLWNGYGQKLESVGGSEITDMPRSPSPPTDRMSDLISRKVEIEEEIAAVIKEQGTERKRIQAALRRIKSPDERAVIRFRYLLGMNWYDVTDAMFGSKEDYLGKEDSYQRRVYILHGKALVHLTPFLAAEEE